MPSIRSPELMKKYGFTKKELDTLVGKMTKGAIGYVSLTGTTFAVDEDAFMAEWDSLTANKVASYRASLPKRIDAGRKNQKLRKQKEEEARKKKEEEEAAALDPVDNPTITDTEELEAVGADEGN